MVTNVCGHWCSYSSVCRWRDRTSLQVCTDIAMVLIATIGYLFWWKRNDPQQPKFVRTTLCRPATYASGENKNSHGVWRQNTSRSTFTRENIFQVVCLELAPGALCTLEIHASWIFGCKALNEHKEIHHQKRNCSCGSTSMPQPQCPIGQDQTNTNSRISYLYKACAEVTANPGFVLWVNICTQLRKRNLWKVTVPA